ncbi:LysR family transcriptional regulator [Clostridium polynesiense]|uniref:LysR family transcriptional regulator n=1 Tax=Clostridium polynesiense TaxID=1325933 RepID=UPI000694DB85|nr:LysR family transcriptional regulator [Clostridium polynesiense]
MHIEYFKFFYDVANCKSISKAASMSHISQSALSQQLNNIENRLGVRLLDRSNKGVELTPQGRLMLKHIEVMLKSYERMLEDVDSFKLDKSLIVIDYYYNLTNPYISSILFNSKKKFPQYELRLNSSPVENIESNLINHISDLGISFKEPEDKSILFSKLLDDNLVLTAASSFNVPRSITSEELINYPLIILNDRINVKRRLHLSLNKYNKNFSDLNVLYMVNAVATAKESALNGYGLTILPRMSISDELKRGTLKEINLKDAVLDYSIYLLHTSDNYKIIKPFIDYMKRECKKIII